MRSSVSILLLLASAISPAVTFGFSLNSFSGQQSSTQLENSGSTRRDFFASIAAATILTASSPAFATSASDAAITDKVFIEFKGLSAPGEKDRIVIGLFGNDAPQPVSILKQLVSKEGYKSKCKPLDTNRVLQKDQLEANKVYNSCIENEVRILFGQYPV